MERFCGAPWLLSAEFEVGGLLAFFSVFGVAAEVSYVGDAVVFADGGFCGDAPCVLFFSRRHLALVVLPCRERPRAYIVPPGVVRSMVASGQIPQKVIVGVRVGGSVDGLQGELPPLASWALRVALAVDPELECQIDRHPRSKGVETV